MMFKQYRMSQSAITLNISMGAIQALAQSHQKSIKNKPN